MKQIEIYKNDKTDGIYQSFIKDLSDDYPYFTPLYLCDISHSQSTTIKKLQNNVKYSYMVNNVKFCSPEYYKKREKNLIVKVCKINKEKDSEILKNCVSFNYYFDKLPARFAEIGCRIAEEKINEIIETY